MIAEVSGDGEYRFNSRQLLYQLRPIVKNELGAEAELQEGNFNGIITDYENEHGEIPGMYHEPRGSITHPHSGQTITLGTFDQAVEHNIAGEPKNVVDAVGLTPRHRLFAAVMAVAADADVSVGPASAHASN